jgi:hypothetical protein
MQAGQQVESRGLDRRALIKRAAAVGAAAWTAPVIIGSLASPAGAATITPGCYRYQYDVNAGFFSSGSCSWVGYSTSSCSLQADPNCSSPVSATDPTLVGLNSPACGNVNTGDTDVLAFSVAGSCRIHAATVRDRNPSLNYDCHQLSVTAAGVQSLNVAPQGSHTWGVDSFVQLLVVCT